MRKSEIRKIGGTPKLFIDGDTACAMAYTTYFEERSRCADFARIGCRLFFVNTSFTTLPINSAATGFSPFRVGVFEDKNRPDYSEFERQIYEIIDACPDAIIFPRIYVSMPKWWVDSHPDEVVLTPKGGYREILFSNYFRKDGAKLLCDFVEHIKNSDYAEHIGGWQICGGQTQEWFHHDLCGSLCAGSEKYYLEWIKNNYGTEASLPKKEDFIYGKQMTQLDENARRYSIFCNLEVAKTVDYFSQALKNATNHSQIVGSFYGYSFECCDTVLFGSHALRALLDSENVDFFSSPNAYTMNRAFGIDWADMIPVDSVKLHGKLCFIECDIRTHLTISIQEARPGMYPDDMYKTGDGASVWVGPPTKELSREGLRKCFAHQLTKSSAIWWFDMWGGWYDDPMLMTDISKMKDIYDKAMETKNNHLRPEVVLFADETGYANLLSSSPHLGGINNTRTAMGNTGVPYDIYMAEDAESVLANYKAAIFIMPIPSDSGKHAMKLCEKMGVPYLCPNADNYELSVDGIRDFYIKNGIHFYTNEKDVVYVGNGYIGLHSGTAGKKILRLPSILRVTPVFGTNLNEKSTDRIVFEIEDNATALFKINDLYTC